MKLEIKKTKTVEVRVTSFAELQRGFLVVWLQSNLSDTGATMSLESHSKPFAQVLYQPKEFFCD